MDAPETDQQVMARSGTFVLRRPASSDSGGSGREYDGGSRGSETPKGQEEAEAQTSNHRRIPEVRTTQGAVNLFIFRLETFDPELPLVMRDSHELPAMTRWFEPRGLHGDHTLSPRLTRYSQTIFPYELTDPAASASAIPGQYPSLGGILTEFRSWLIAHSNERYLPLMSLIAALADPSTLHEDDDPSSYSADHSGSSSTPQKQEFRQFYAPLGLLARACEFNATRPRQYPHTRLQRLYIAQCPVDHLPKSRSKDGGKDGNGDGDLAKEDLPTPGLVHGAGRGDIYGSSVWLGLEPTCTPLHRDPNPNLFCQLLGEKHVRILPPARGQALYERVRAEVGMRGDANSRLRGAEMMGGVEREALERAVWGEGEDAVVEEGQADMQQAVLRPGDTMFIPKGWWHSVRSNGAGVLNASVNWWFR
ncbi:hypothetical protein SLS62_003354 [Diatrype stigma]|uniref:JmjC domain-containing protein n=1 Tax=Diatrype stigma TaxID=117547 RepID=A0AAN9UWG6_9PEZI